MPARSCAAIHFKEYPLAVKVAQRSTQAQYAVALAMEAERLNHLAFFTLGEIPAIN